jgi:hypothetical protein
MVAGYFVTKQSTVSKAGTTQLAYANYNTLFPDDTAYSTPTNLDYSGIATDSFRWATFKWSVASLGTALTFRIEDVTGTIPTIADASPFLVGGLKVYYRIEDTNTPTPTGTNEVTTSVNNPGCYSTVWLDATAENTVTGSNCTNIDKNPTTTFSGLGGLANRSSVSVNGGVVTLTVYSPRVSGPIAAPGGTPAWGLNIYLAVGLPMGSNWAFTGTTMSY